MRVLIVEDLPPDADLMVRELRKTGMAFVVRCVVTREEYLRELGEFRPDIVLSDYSLPAFDGLKALEILRQADTTRKSWQKVGTTRLVRLGQDDE